MIWHWFREWRERRSVIADLKRRQRLDEADLANLELNPVYLAKLALERGDHARVAAYWEQARMRLPNFIYESKDALWVLLGLKRYDEAEALMR